MARFVIGTGKSRFPSGMVLETERFVPKVHPATREIEAEDPMELMAEIAPGDPDVMLNCMVPVIELLVVGFVEISKVRVIKRRLIETIETPG